MAAVSLEVFGDPWPEEPDDPYPEYLNPFPQYGEPVEPVTVNRQGGRTSGESVPPAIQSGLLALLGVVRIGLFALALGPMLMFLGDEWYYGKLVTGIGVVACTYAAHRYLVYRDLVRKL